MGDLEKILIIVNRWGYLNLEQISLLLNKNIKTIQLQKEQLVNLKMMNVDTLPKKNYYTLISKAQSHLGRVHKKSIKVNYYELVHQDMLLNDFVVKPISSTAKLNASSKWKTVIWMLIPT